MMRHFGNNVLAAASNALKEDSEFILMSLRETLRCRHHHEKQTYNLLGHMSQSLKETKGFTLNFIELYPKCFRFFDTFLNDRDVIKKAATNNTDNFLLVYLDFG